MGISCENSGKNTRRRCLAYSSSLKFGYSLRWAISCSANLKDVHKAVFLSNFRPEDSKNF